MIAKKRKVLSHYCKQQIVQLYFEQKVAYEGIAEVRAEAAHACSIRMNHLYMKLSDSVITNTLIQCQGEDKT